MRFCKFIEDVGRGDVEAIHVEPSLVAYLRPHRPRGTELVLLNGQVLVLAEDANTVLQRLETAALGGGT